MTDTPPPPIGKKFIIMKPEQLGKLGGWFGRVANAENHDERYYECFHPSPLQAFQACYWWCLGEQDRAVEAARETEKENAQPKQVE